MGNPDDKYLRTDNLTLDERGKDNEENTYSRNKYEYIR